MPKIAITQHEYSLDNGSTWLICTAPMDNGDGTATITGITGAVPIGHLIVRVLGETNPANYLLNTTPFTVATTLPTVFAPMQPIFDGDSLTAYGRNNSVKTVLNDAVNFVSTGTGAQAGSYPLFAVAGNRIDQQLATISNVISAKSTDPDIEISVVSFLCGINSLVQRHTAGYSATVQQIYDQYKAYFTALNNAGIYGIAYTLTSNRGSSGNYAAIDADKAEFNDLVRDGFANGELPGVLALVDLATDYRIGPDDAGLNTDYFTDGLHWYTVDGDLVVAMMEKEAYENIKNGIIGVVVTGESAPAAVPTITSFTPTTATSGDSVVITGTDFTGTTAVTVNNVAVTSFTVNSATQITAIIAAGNTTGTIKVTTPAGTATSGGTLTVTGGSVTNRALKFTGTTNQYASPPPADYTNTVTLNADFEIEIRVRLTAFASQYIWFVDNKFSLIYGYVANKFELYHETSAFPRTQFSTNISDTNWHVIKMKLQGGTLSAEMDGVSQLSVATAADVNCQSWVYLGGVAADSGLLTGEVDYLTLKKANALVHSYDYNEAGFANAIDSVSGADMVLAELGVVTRVDI